MRIVNLEQGSDDWLLWRGAGITSSDAAVIMGCSPWNNITDLWKEKASLAVPSPRLPSSAMERGKRLEGVARDLYERLMGFLVPPVCGIHDSEDWIKTSLDGWNERFKVVAEFKAVKKEDHFQALGGEVPEKYYWQCQHHLLASGARICHYTSYSPQQSEKHRRLKILEVFPGEDTYRLLSAETEFWRSVREKIPPRDGDAA
jgi:putative phage-type endonuclease